MEERRRHVRFRINQAIEVSLGKENYIYLDGVNVSESGMMCISRECLDIGSRLFLMFEIPRKDDVHMIQCEGIIVRCLEEKDGYNLGIQFSSLEDNDRKILGEYSAAPH